VKPQKICVETALPKGAKFETKPMGEIQIFVASFETDPMDSIFCMGQKTRFKGKRK
jgi:hypothetical protein